MAPPAKGKPATSKKTEQKKKEKVIEDKTFGLKNKKGAKQQKFIQQVEKTVKNSNLPARKLDELGKKKEEKAKDALEMNMLFKPVQKVDKGVDPKSILCAYFKNGLCQKGNKCKFSHDLTIERKAEKRSLYVDMRDGEGGETMENWTDEKLKEVVAKKHGEEGGSSEKTRPTTDIICKYFLEAVEKNLYGWFWSCPNGGSCMYRHALPPGFVLKKDRAKDDKKDIVSLEELIEEERAKLNASKTTKITLETFLKWKKRKLAERVAAEEKDREKKHTDFKAGLHVGLSGREMFSFNPELANTDAFDDGDEAFDSYTMNEEDGEENEQYYELDLATFSMLDNEATFGGDGEGGKENGERANEASVIDPDQDATGALNEDLFADELDDLEEELKNCGI